MSLRKGTSYSTGWWAPLQGPPGAERPDNKRAIKAGFPEEARLGGGGGSIEGRRGLLCVVW